MTEELALQDLKNLVVEKAVQRTALFQRLLEESANPITPSEFSVTMNELVNGKTFGCYTPKVQEVIKVIAQSTNMDVTGLFVEPAKKKIKYPIGAVVFQNQNSGMDDEFSEDYKECVFLIMKGKHNIYVKGENILHEPDRPSQIEYTDVRPATVEEIKAVVDKVVTSIPQACKILNLYEEPSKYE